MDEAVSALLGAKTVAVVGLDARQERPAYRVARYLKEHGYEVAPVPVQQPAEGVLGHPAYPNLRAIPFPVDVVDVFVRPADTDAIIDDAIAIGAKVLWLQQGITNGPGLERARKAGLIVTEDRCAMVEHRRALGVPASAAK